MHESNHIPLYYFPVEDVRMDLQEKTDNSTHCPYKGDASYWSVKVGDRIAENAVWGYEKPDLLLSRILLACLAANIPNRSLRRVVLAH